MGDPTRTAREVVELYNLSVWNESNFDMADELVADTMIRHEVGSGHAVTREQVRKGIEDFLALSTRCTGTLILSSRVTTASTSPSSTTGR
jgi:hypothetical protein